MLHGIATLLPDALQVGVRQTNLLGLHCAALSMFDLLLHILMCPRLLRVHHVKLPPSPPCASRPLHRVVQAVPYWVDDESVRASMAASGPSPPRSIEGCAV